MNKSLLVKNRVLWKDDDDYDVLFTMVSSEGLIIPGVAERRGGQSAGDKTVAIRVGPWECVFGTKIILEDSSDDHDDWSENEEDFQRGNSELAEELSSVDWFWYLENAHNDEDLLEIDELHFIRDFEKDPIPSLSHWSRAEDLRASLAAFFAGDSTPFWFADLPSDWLAVVESRLLSLSSGHGLPPSHKRI